MHQKNLPTIPTCQCGSQDFETVFGGRNHLGRYEYRIACRSCKTVMVVGKSTFALFRYLNNYKPSRPFLKLFDLDQEQCR